MTTWVIREESHGVRPGKPPIVTWWCGPDHGWGRTFGPPDMAHKFRTRKEAETAFRDEFGIRVAWKPQRSQDAIAEYETWNVAYEARTSSHE